VDRYAREILSEIDQLISECHPLAAGLSLNLLCPAGALEKSPFVNIPLQSLPNAPGHVWEQLVLPRNVRGGLLSLCNSGPLASRKQIVCIHDVNTRLVPESYDSLFRMAYRFLHPALGRRAMRIVTVSRFSQTAMARLGVASLEKIQVIHCGREHALHWNPDHCSVADLDLSEPFILLVGSKAPHKNAVVIYSIAAKLAAIGIHVLVAGGEDANVYARGVAGLPPPSVRFLGKVNDDDLALLYRRALCLALPSKTEGFGLPALEAMTLGCPVVSSDAGALPELCGDAVLYAPPNDSQAWLAAIERIAAEATLRERLASAGRKRSEVFSWRDGAKRFLQLMLTIDSAS
jgi:glycosyltransferase involved in cell wall biosynthesis